MATTRMGWPAEMGVARLVRARHWAPRISTVPSGLTSASAMPISPTIDSRPMVGVEKRARTMAGMPAMVRARFSTHTIGRESMVGEMGMALADVSPEGTVEIRGAQWRARTNRATPISAGQPIRVVAIDGLLLEVEPEAGGARDAHH